MAALLERRCGQTRPKFDENTESEAVPTLIRPWSPSKSHQLPCADVVASLGVLAPLRIDQNFASGSKVIEGVRFKDGMQIDETKTRGYKLHVDTADGGIPISCIMTSASTHDSQVAIPLGTLTAGRVENLYDLMDAAYDSIEIWAHCILLGHKPIIDVNPRRSVEMQEALKQEKKARRTLGLVFPEERRYVVRSGSERINGRLKDEFGGRHVRVRGYDKVLAHLMFGMTVLTASQLMRLIVPPI